MYNDKSFLGIIPARGGSKGLRNKNILPIAGKPLIAWTIEQALSSKYLDKVIVNTDSIEITDISKKYGADAPFLRPNDLATDEARMIDVVLYAMEHLEEDGYFYDSVMLLQPTSPLRTVFDIDSAIEMMITNSAGAVVSVCEMEHHPYWSNSLPHDKCMKDFLKPEVRNKNRQQLPVFYRLNGAIYLAYSSYLKGHRDFIGDRTYAYIMSKERSVDIDSELDFKLAELLLMQTDKTHGKEY